VGDAEFQKKAIGKMQDVSKQDGRTVLFVSHNMNAVKSLCKQSILLDKGGVEIYADTNYVISNYLKSKIIDANFNIKNVTEKCTDNISIEKILINSKENNAFIKNSDKTFTIELVGNLKSDTKLGFEFRIFDIYGNPIAIYSPNHMSGEIDYFKKGDFSISKTINTPENITHGHFMGEFSITYPGISYYFKTTPYFNIEFEGKMIASGIPFEFDKDGIINLD